MIVADIGGRTLFEEVPVRLSGWLSSPTIESILIFLFLESALGSLDCQVQASNAVVTCTSALDLTQVLLTYMCSYDDAAPEPCKFNNACR